jgi:hypothetical protein
MDIDKFVAFVSNYQVNAFIHQRNDKHWRLRLFWPQRKAAYHTDFGKTTNMLWLQVFEMKRDALLPDNSG